jgi:hypothetical protein
MRIYSINHPVKKRCTVVFIVLLEIISTSIGLAQSVKNNPTVQVIPLAQGWANNSVNAVAFRRDALVTFKGFQYTAYYDAQSNMVLAKRKQGTVAWEKRVSQYKGPTNDAHNSISLGIDGLGYLHLSWGQHAVPLNYCRSISPGSLELSEKTSMTGKSEVKVTYPQFYTMPSGDMLFLYRDGVAGNGNLILNYYNIKDKKWQQRQENLIDGEGHRNAYWQMAIDKFGTIHLSWVWRETGAGGVADNHDMCYAKSMDGGITWKKTTGETYTIPITASTAEYAVKIPTYSDLINQTSTCTDSKGNPYIVTYWRGKTDSVPQYKMIYYNGSTWHVRQVATRHLPFTLIGTGTKRIPVARPMIVMANKSGRDYPIIIFRDEERNNKVSAAIGSGKMFDKWEIKDLSQQPVGQWEPVYDSRLWQSQQVLNLFVQEVAQADGEGLENFGPRQISVLSWKP